MDPWVASGYLLLGAGAGALTTAALHIKQIRKLKDLLQATRSNSQTEEQGSKLDERKSA